MASSDKVRWVFAILAILQPIPVFCFPPHLSSLAYHFKALEIILAEQPFIFCTSLYVFPSEIDILIKVILIKVRCSSEQCLEQPIFFRFSERTDSGARIEWILVLLVFYDSTMPTSKLFATCYYYFYQKQ
ncbi:hypothetical protein ILYODFUR_012178 [Ilyodon furcidens]|uniref:Uncharacterized protein n=1 Tax=Ilyodon furcidens TaxID=33524 RepID=A0ABV0U4R2_9TELE